MERPPLLWKSYDIDEILHKGHMLYHQIGTFVRLLPSDIPEYITVDKKNYRLGLFSSGCQDFKMMTIDMLTDVFRQFCDFLLCIGERASAILQEENTYFIYDSHSRNKNGFPDADGTSVLLTFNLVEKMYHYITNLTMNLNTDAFELTPPEITIGIPDYYMKADILNKKSNVLSLTNHKKTVSCRSAYIC